MSEHLQARELSPDEADALVHRAFETERAIKADLAALHADTWTLAKHLYEFREQRGWTLLGYGTLNEFLAQPEIGISSRWFFRLAQMWRDLVEVKQVSAPTLRDLEPSKVQEVMPAIMSGTVKPDDALADAKALGFRDLREKYRLPAIAGHGQAPDGSTPLAAENEPVRVPCPHCNPCRHCDGSGWRTE